jgi:hypothetical protein
VCSCRTGQDIFRYSGHSQRMRVSSPVVDKGRSHRLERPMPAFSFPKDGGDACMAANFALPTLRIRVLADGDVYAASGPADWKAYLADRHTDAGVRGTVRGRFKSSGG